MAPRTDGPKTDPVAPRFTVDNRPRIWCAHCNAHHLTIGDANRHYRDSNHPMVERAVWFFEIYANSRHGDTTAAQSARARVAQVAASVQNGTPITAAQLNGNTTAHAVLASDVPGNSPEVYQQIQTSHATVLQVAPLLVAAPIQQPVLAPPPPFHIIAPNPQPAIMQAAPLPVTASIQHQTLIQAGPQPVVAPNPQHHNAPIGHTQGVAPPTVQCQYPDPEECSLYGFDRNWVQPS